MFSFFTHRKKPRVFVGVSGGVDSAVSVGLLKKKGYDVVGVFIKTWHPEWAPCPWHQERRDAIRVCAHFKVPFLECDAEEAYKKNVADMMIRDYARGRTPNPDVACNREIKFGVFLDFAKARGADFIATGHYAQVKKDSLGIHHLLRGIDPAKDQSYFLWTLTENDLAQTLFPVGNMHKKEVRRYALRWNLPVAEKKDSQGICFLGPVDMKSFLSHYISTVQGDVVDVSGRIIGRHDGVLFSTLGERHGFVITEKTPHDKPLYVVAKDIQKNTLTVDVDPEIFSRSCARSVSLEQANILVPEILNQDGITAQFRYHGTLHSASNIIVRGGFIECDIPGGTPVPGQSVVFYNDDELIAGGIVAG